MRVLADTHVLIWFAQNDPKLSARTHRLLADPTVQFYFSLESIREIAIKSALLRTDFRADAYAIYNGLVQSDWTELPVNAEHIFALRRLPQIHRDPFDRMLVAQAMVQGLTLLTADTLLDQYSISVIRP